MSGRTKLSAKQKRQALWEALNERQQRFLSIIYALDQAAEADHAAAGARGAYDKRPATQWRQIDFTHEPYDRDLFGITELQRHLEHEGHHNQGNGATVKVLVNHGLVEQDMRGTRMGVVHTLRLTREGRAVYRAGTGSGGRTATVDLTGRAWQVLGALWAAHQQGKPLNWTYSTTIEHVLIAKHGLAERAESQLGYRITASGRVYYRSHWTEYAGTYPEINTPHPDGVQPWPAATDTALADASRRYQNLADAWKETWSLHEEAVRRATAEPQPTDSTLPELIALRAERHTLDTALAAQQVALAEQHLARLDELAQTAAYSYARAAAAAFTAAVERTDPPTAITAVSEGASTLPVPTKTGFKSLDSRGAQLHAAAIGQPLPRKGPPPRRRPNRQGHATPPRPSAPAAPHTDVATYADHLARQVRGGQLQRLLHAERLAPAEEPDKTPAR
ncbi:hypothetical protein ABT039_22280 [Streptomyces lasiicapitis]|uniref:hypothetical protein n=1 Tax=Streptomyces lasiicapitis TaxID=1923961 RepID=UPI00332BCCE9